MNAHAAASTHSSLLLDNQLCFSLYAANNAMNRLYRARLQALQLTYPQYLVMLVLWEAGAQSVSSIGKRLFLDSATLTPLLKRLERAGLVTRQRSDRDERQVIIGLTDAGIALRERAVEVPAAVMKASGCAPADLQQLRSQLNALRLQLDGSESPQHQAPQ